MRETQFGGRGEGVKKDGEPLTAKQAKDKIATLTPELKAVAEKYLVMGQAPAAALEQADCQAKINGLRVELKDIAEKYLGLGHTPESAWKQARSFATINVLRPELKEVAEKYLAAGHSPVAALEQALSTKINETPRPYGRGFFYHANFVCPLSS